MLFQGNPQNGNLLEDARPAGTDLGSPHLDAPLVFEYLGNVLLEPSLTVFSCS